MKINVVGNRLRRTLESDAVSRNRYGAELAKKLRLRLTALAAAESLADFWPPFGRPERCHELKGAERGTFSMDLAHPFRLIFRPTSDPEPPADPDEHDERQRWLQIDEIDILDVKDTHG